jgi:hypothetical protein
MPEAFTKPVPAENDAVLIPGGLPDPGTASGEELTPGSGSVEGMPPGESGLGLFTGGAALGIGSMDGDAPGTSGVALGVEPGQITEIAKLEAPCVEGSHPLGPCPPIVQAASIRSDIPATKVKGRFNVRINIICPFDVHGRCFHTYSTCDFRGNPRTFHHAFT